MATGSYMTPTYSRSQKFCRLGRGRENGIIEHRWCDGQVCPDVGQEIMAPLVQTARVRVCVLRTNRTREAERDFCGLSMRRYEGRVVDPPWCLKGFLGDERRALEGENLRRALEKKKGETMNAGGVG
ncbi:hypothetical protein TNCV_4303111 [Trichonephila clavipes]|nr:hypothetical protein TNCV_4303111 [Trichonephila clavipes]